MAAAGACHECGAPAADACEVCRRPTCAESYAESDYFGVCLCCLRTLEADGPPHTWPYPLRKPLPPVRQPGRAGGRTTGDAGTDVYDVPSAAFDQYQFRWASSRLMRRRRSLAAPPRWRDALRHATWTGVVERRYPRALRLGPERLAYANGVCAPDP